jgi:heat shock protein HslJ
MIKKSKISFLNLTPEKIFLILAVVILIGSGFYLAYSSYFQSSQIKTQSPNGFPVQITKVPDLKNPDYLNKLIAKEWFWVETVIDSSVGIKPLDSSSFRIKFNPDNTFGSSSDCNIIAGNYSIQENKIVFNEIVRSEKYCMKSKESDYVEGLTNANEIMFNEKNELILRFNESNSFMRFR